MAHRKHPGKAFAVILAAGQSVRMKSKTPKVLHPLAGVPMIEHLTSMLAGLELARVVVVVGPEGQEIRPILGQGYLYVEQKEALGTAHALLQTSPLLEKEGGTVLVFYADHPLVTAETISGVLENHGKEKAALTLLTFHPPDPTGYGRILRDAQGKAVGIVEEAVANEAEREITEVNSCPLCFEANWLWPNLKKVKISAKGEYYLTDLLAIAASQGEKTLTLSPQDQMEGLGINTRVDLARAEAVLRRRIRERLMLCGVTMDDPPSTFIDAPVEIGADTILRPGTIIEGKSIIGTGCSIGPHTRIRDSRVGNNCTITSSTVEEASLGEDVHVGPYSHLRPGTHLATGVHVGNFVEIKASQIGRRSKVGHFSYLGDAIIGEEVNIGAGTVTCNYDGKTKHKTFIEDRVFIGSDTMLVAPVTVGRGAKTGAGSVVTRDLPPKSLAYGVPARVVKAKRNKDESR